MTENMLVKLNHVVGCHLLTFLDGIDAINFIEAVNDSEQFLLIAKTVDYHFIEAITNFCRRQPISLSVAPFEHNLMEDEISDEQFPNVSRRYSCFIKPLERPYVHPCFAVEGLVKLCPLYQTSLFKCYSRLIPYNNAQYDATFDLLNYELYIHSIGSRRILNDHEKKLFHVNNFFRTKTNRNCRFKLSFVRTIAKFKLNFAQRFSSLTWLEAIDLSKWAIIGGCVVNCLCELPFEDTENQTVDLVFYGSEKDDFESMVEATVNSLNIKIATNATTMIQTKKIPGSFSYNVPLPCNVTLRFCLFFAQSSKYSLSHILHNLDTDISQIAFVGDKILTTFPFFEALATKSFILYDLHAEIPRHICTRVERYCNRGFHFLEPNAFDDDFTLLMQQEEVPMYRLEHYQYIDDNNEIRVVTKEYYRSYRKNVDTYQLQEEFIRMACPSLLEYK